MPVESIACSRIRKKKRSLKRDNIWVVEWTGWLRWVMKAFFEFGCKFSLKCIKARTFWGLVEAYKTGLSVFLGSLLGDFEDENLGIIVASAWISGWD